MVQIVGKYQHVSNSPEFAGLLRDLGSPEETIKPIIDSKPVISVSQAGDQWTICVSNAGKDASSTFKLGEPYDEAMPGGLVVKSVTKRDGDKFITASALGDGKGGTRIYEFTDAGINVQMIDDKSGKKATRTYKRV